MPPPLVAAGKLGVSYRPMTDEDIPFLAGVYFSTRAEEVALTGWPEEVQLQFLGQQFDAQHRHYMAHYDGAEWLVIEQGGEGVGRLYLVEWDDEFRIIDIAVLPAFRRRGIGKAILDDIAAMADSVGKRVSIHVEINNPAMVLYEALGYSEVDASGYYVRMERPARGVAAS